MMKVSKKSTKTCQAAKISKSKGQAKSKCLNAQKGEKTIHLASKRGNFKAVKQLLDGGIAVDCRDSSKRTPLHQAAWYGHHDICLLLLERGAKVLHRNVKFETPLHMAVINDHLHIAELLLKHGARASACDSKGITPSDIAENSSVVQLKTLLQKKAAEELNSSKIPSSKGAISKTRIFSVPKTKQRAVKVKTVQEKVDDLHIERLNLLTTLKQERKEHVLEKNEILMQVANLRGKLQVYENVEDENEKLETKLSDLKKDQEKDKKQIKNLEADKIKLNKNIGELEKSKSEFKDKIERLNNEGLNLRNQVIQLQKVQSKWQNQNAEANRLRSAIATQRLEITLLSTKLESKKKLEDEVKEMKTKIFELEDVIGKEKLKFQNTAQAWNVQKANFEGEHARLEQVISMHLDEIHRRGEEVEALRKENMGLDYEISELKKKEEVVEGMLALKADFETMERENEKLKKEKEHLESLKERFKRLAMLKRVSAVGAEGEANDGGDKNSVENLKKELKKLKMKRKKAKQDIKDLKSEADSLEKSNVEMRVKLGKNEEIVKKLKGEKRSWEVERVKLATSIADLQSKNKELIESVGKYEASMSAMQTDNKNLNATLAQERAITQQLKQQLVRANAKHRKRPATFKMPSKVKRKYTHRKVKQENLEPQFTADTPQKDNRRKRKVPPMQRPAKRSTRAGMTFESSSGFSFQHYGERDAYAKALEVPKNVPRALRNLKRKYFREQTRIHPVPTRSGRLREVPGGKPIIDGYPVLRVHYDNATTDERRVLLLQVLERWISQSFKFQGHKPWCSDTKLEGVSERLPPVPEHSKPDNAIDLEAENPFRNRAVDIDLTNGKDVNQTSFLVKSEFGLPPLEPG